MVSSHVLAAGARKGLRNAGGGAMTPPPPNPGEGPGTPPDPGTPPTEPPGDGLVDRLIGGLALWHHGATDGATITDLVAGLNGTVTTGQTIALQPSLVTGDPYNSMLYAGDAYATVPANPAHAVASGGVLVVFQFQPVARWLSLVDRFGDSWSNPGGFNVAIAYTSGAYRLRGQIHDGVTNVVIQPGSVALQPGVAYGAVLTWGPAGLKLYLGNADSAAEIGTDDATAGALGTYKITIGADWSGALRFAGAIDLVALYDGQPDEATVLADLDEVKAAGVIWANDATVTVQTDAETVFDPRPMALVDSTTPTAVVTVQPSNATATAEVDGTITIAAGSTPGSSANGRYTLDGSPAAVLGVTVTDPPASLYLNPFSAESALHIPIGTGATYAAASDPATAALIGQPNLITVNRGYPFGANFMEISESDPERTITWNGSLSGFGLNGTPVTIRVPTILASWWNASFPTSDNCTVLYDPATGLIHDFYRFNPLTFTASIYRSFPVTGPGHATVLGSRIGPTAIGASRASGCLRAHEILDDELEVTHGYFFACPARPGSHTIVLGREVVFPGCSVDSFAGVATNNTGALPYAALMALPPESAGGPDIDSIGISELGKRVLARPFRRYGMRPQDDGSTINMALDRKQLPTDEAAEGALEAAIATLIADWKTIWPYMRRVTDAVTFTGTPAAIAIGGSAATGDIGVLNGDPIGGGTAIDDAPNTGYVAP